MGHNARERLLAAEKLLHADSTTADKFESLQELLEGINPKLDKTLSLAAGVVKKIEQLQEKAVIELTAEALPEKTAKQKRRKKYLLVLLKYWDELNDEVDRIQAELASADTKAVKAGKIAGLAKGPLGTVTIVAGVIAAGLIALNSVAVNIVIQNQGCDTIEPQTMATVSLPGLKIPNQPIPPGGTGTATLPPLVLTVDNSSGNSLRLTAYGVNLSFDYSSDVDITFDGTSLMGKNTTLNLGDQKNHQLVVQCL